MIHTMASRRRKALYTGMLKREKGYNPDAGDWEFFTLDSKAMLVTARVRTCFKQRQLCRRYSTSLNREKCGSR